MERDRVEITVPFDKEIFENSNRKFWLNGSRPHKALRQSVTYWGPKMTRKSIESSSVSKEGCLQSIERLKAQPASRDGIYM